MGIMMYQRIEAIEEECLDWDNHFAHSNEKISTEIRQTVISPPVFNQSKMFLNKGAWLLRKHSFKRKFTTLVADNLGLFLIFSILVAPYLLGFLLSYFLFYFYGNVPISSFFSLQHAPISFELWAIGAYLLVTVGEAWVLLSSR